MITAQQKEIARQAMDFARKEGSQQVRVSLDTATGTCFEVRDMKVDCLRRKAETALQFYLFVDGRFGAFSTNRIHRDELEPFIRNAIRATRLLAQDEARTLPDPARYYRGTFPDLQSHDPAFPLLDSDAKISLAMQACDEITGKDSRILSANASFEDTLEAAYLLDSNGFEAEQPAATSFSLSASVSLQDPHSPARPEDYWYHSAVHFDDLTQQGIGHEALRRTLAKLGQSKASSGKYPMLLDNTVAPHFLAPLINALYGSAIQQNNSFLLNKLGGQIASPCLTLIDEPHLPRAFGARLFDGEGVATVPRTLIHKGVLQTYCIDTYYAHKLNIPPTLSSPSIPSLQKGSKGFDELLAGIDRGIRITGINGGNCNTSTGDFSYGIEGFLIENGKPVRPLSEMNVTGNMLLLWKQLKEVGNDPLLVSSWRIPSLLFDAVDFSGS
ncbi:MAG: TldD/PmbA family protein [Tannerellaceae bacterium]|jgi:PmbA protein|nr:TldD/PmbA family protein [Tannerellaceae bacterium]